VPASDLERLRSLLGPTHVLTGVDLSSYVVDGRTPEAAVFPGTAEEVAAVLGLAAAAGLPVVPWGAGTAASVGVPATPGGLVLGLRRLSALVEHEPGDLTATAQAGMTVAALQAALGARGQWLSLDPGEPERATLGGVISADASGPRRHLYGTMRDLLIGVAVATAAGTLVRGGGKVVKNVAGYDLPKLFIGAYGTLGVIVEATVKLRPRPEDERLVALGFDRLKDAGSALRALLASDLIPSAVELLDGATGAAVVGAEAPGATLVVGFDGLAEQVAWQCAELPRVVAPHGARGARPLPATTWGRLGGAACAAALPTAAAVMVFSVLPMHVAELMEQGAGAARARGLPSAWAAHAGVGAVTAALGPGGSAPGSGAVAATLVEWRQMARAGGGHATLEQAPLALKAEVPVWDDPGAAGRIMQRIKTQLDPKGILNPGRFVAGI
jgi:glycolate oxidase FAD binding subunit